MTAENADSVTDAEYAAACGKVAGIITAILEAEPETRELDALDLWDWMETPSMFGVDPETSFLQWSVALDVVRESMGLPALPRYGVAIIGVMADPGFRRVARQILHS